MTEKEQGTRHVVAPDAADAGKRLDVVLAGHLAGISRSRIKGLIEAGQVTPEAGGAPITAPSARVRAGQTFAIVVPYSADAEPGAEAIPLAVLFEDAEVLVLDKPAGLVVHAAGPTDEGFRIVALWESEEAWQRFAERVRSAEVPSAPLEVLRTLHPAHVVYGEREE